MVFHQVLLSKAARNDNHIKLGHVSERTRGNDMQAVFRGHRDCVLPGDVNRGVRHSHQDPFRLLQICLVGWLNQQQQDVIDYLQEENRVLREHLEGKRLRF